MKLAVCGCSFSATVPSVPNTHWSEILASKMSAKLHNFARGGISNDAIRVQIDEAINIDPDYVIISSTSSNRLTFPRYPNTESTGQITLENFNYVENSNSHLVSEHFNSILKNNKPEIRNLNTKTKKAILSYIECLHDLNWKKQLDKYIIQEGLWKLHDLGVNFYYNSYYDIPEKFSMPQWFVERYFLPKTIRFQNVCRLYNLEEKDDPGYHISYKGQQFIANNIYKLIKQKDMI
jgi:hypothetical protein